MVPAATPLAIVQKLSRDLQTVLADPELQNKLKARVSSLGIWTRSKPPS
ncbi:hypothetical protein ACVBEH_01560 [Roseateles sp. GG27B]